MKNVKIPVIISVISLLIIITVGNSFFSIGILIDKLSPCTQDPTTSFPCFGIYDLWLMAIMTGIFISSTIVIIYKLVKAKNHNNT
jgi:hypothetical protein